MLASVGMLKSLPDKIISSGPGPLYLKQTFFRKQLQYADTAMTAADDESPNKMHHTIFTVKINSLNLAACLSLPFLMHSPAVTGSLEQRQWHNKLIVNKVSHGFLCAHVMEFSSDSSIIIYIGHLLRLWRLGELPPSVIIRPLTIVIEWIEKQNYRITLYNPSYFSELTFEIVWNSNLD